MTVVILAGSVTAIVSGRDIFPFSNYPMYARSHSPERPAITYQIVGVLADGREIPLPVRSAFSPLWSVALIEATLADPTPEVTAGKARALLHWYEQRAITRPRLPPLMGLRVYRYEIPWAVFVNLRPETPLPVEFRATVAEAFR